MSITKKMEHEMNLWATEMNKSNNFLALSRQEKIFEFLNHRENLCTPGFLLRRQLCLKFPKIVAEAAEKSGLESYSDLIKCGNIKWAPKMIEHLASILTTTKFAGFGKGSLGIEKKQWQNYLLDKAHCQRKTAIKLLFALEMDDAIVAKFLLSNDNELLSLRNPFDYACKTCLIFGLTYEDAEEIFKHFLDLRYAGETKNTKGLTDNFTQRIKSETVSLRENDTITADELKTRLKAAMLKYKDDFSEAGYSWQNIKRLRIFLKYLMILYPTVERFFGTDFFANVAIEKNSDGTPKILRHLVTSMYDAQEIDLPEYTEVAAYGGPDLPQRGTLKRLYDSIPFNKDVLIPLRSLSQTLRSILRAIICPENAQAVARDTVLLLTYFFITGWRAAEADTKEKFQTALESDMGLAEEDSPEEELLFALEDVSFAIDSLDEGDEEPLKVYITVLNRVLTPFEFNEVYAPFVLDRFILLCLLSNERYIMNLVIYASYRLSKNLIDKMEGGKNDGL